jgi:hypothetical protein
MTPSSGSLSASPVIPGYPWRRRTELAALEERLRNLIGVLGDGGSVPEALKDECVRLDGNRRHMMLAMERRADGLQSGAAINPLAHPSATS